MPAAHLKLRLKALMIDYVTIVIYLLVLLLVSLSLYIVILDGMPELTESQSHWTSFLTTVLPIWTYYVFKEAKPPHQTLGKKRAGLTVTYTRNRIRGSILRNIGKFLPWQLAHYAMIKGLFQDDFLLPSVLITYVLSLALPILYILMVPMSDKTHQHQIL